MSILAFESVWMVQLFVVLLVFASLFIMIGVVQGIRQANYSRKKERTLIILLCTMWCGVILAGALLAFNLTDKYDCVTKETKPNAEIIITTTTCVLKD